MTYHLFGSGWFEFLHALTVKEIKSRYKKAVLGFLWILLNPILQMVMIGLIFQFFVPVKVNNYYLFLFTGLLPWNFFSYSVTKNTPMILNERSLIKKSSFPREAIILSVVMSNLFHMLIAWLLLLILLVADKLFTEHYGITELMMYTLRMMLSLPLIGWLVMLTSGFSFLFSALNVRYRDVNFVVQAIMPLWFYATPLVYTLQILPHKLSQLLYLNPLTGLIELFHAVLLNQPVYEPTLVVVDFLLSIVFFLIGCLVFSREAPFFDDWI
jgi:lipopolysaccharide transport system permease protein